MNDLVGCFFGASGVVLCFRDMIKILRRGAIGASIVELYGVQAREMKEELAEMGMV